MPEATTLLLIVLGVIGAAFVILWMRALLPPGLQPSPYEQIVGVITDFFDTLGIGSFATTTSLYRPMKVVQDEKLPGTLNVGHTLPTILQAFLYIDSVKVEPATLIGMIAASVLGAWLGAGVVSGWSRRRIQIGMGIALLVAAAFFVSKNLKLGVRGEESFGLSAWLLAAGLVGNFILGALMTLGIGLYAPCIVLVSLLGMNESTAFPIMMGSCAFLMPVASVRFIRAGSYSAKAAIGLTLGGLPAVYVAWKFFRGLDMETVRWLVVAVVLYTAVTMLWSAFAAQRKGTS